MAKIKVIAKDNMVTVVAKSQKKEQLNIPMAEWITRNMIQGFIPMNIQQGANNSFEVIYNATGYVTLKSCLKTAFNRQTFPMFLQSMVTTLASLDTYNMNYSNILLGLDEVMINPADMSVGLLYYPAENYNNGKYFNIFLEDLLSRIKFPKNENSDYINELKRIIGDVASLSWDVLLGYVKNVMMMNPMQNMNNQQPQNNGNMMQNNGASMQNNSNQMQNGSPMQNNGMNNSPELQYNMANNGYMQNQMMQDASMNQPQANAPISMSNGSLTGGGADVCPSCGFSNLPHVKFCVKCGAQMEDNISQSLSFMNNYNDNSYNMNAGNAGDVDIDYDETTVLSLDEDDDATTVLSQDPIPMRTYPYLIRSMTQEKIVIDKDVFVIGKSKTCDYPLDGNTAISRNHANIEYVDGQYYFVDNQSTNHSFINGIILQPNARVELENLCKLTLANEEFVYYCE